MIMPIFAVYEVTKNNTTYPVWKPFKLFAPVVHKYNHLFTQYYFFCYFCIIKHSAFITIKNINICTLQLSTLFVSIVINPMSIRKACSLF